MISSANYIMPRRHTPNYICSVEGCTHSYGSERANLEQIVQHRENAGHNEQEKDMQRTNANPEGNPDGLLDVWLRFETSYDDATGEPYEEASHEANTYRDEDGYRIEWYLNAVGQVTRVYFDTYEECTAWYEREGFQDFTVNE